MQFCDMSKCIETFCYLVVALMWHRLEYYGLHSWHIGKFHFRYVKGTNYMGPACKDTQKTTINLCTYQQKGVCGKYFSVYMKIYKPFVKGLNINKSEQNWCIISTRLICWLQVAKNWMAEEYNTYTLLTAFYQLGKTKNCFFSCTFFRVVTHGTHSKNVKSLH